jgi:hypothetical protein
MSRVHVRDFWSHFSDQAVQTAELEVKLVQALKVSKVSLL